MIDSEIDFKGYEYHPEVDMSGYIPLEERGFDPSPPKILPARCPISLEDCHNLKLDCHECSVFRRAFSYFSEVRDV